MSAGASISSIPIRCSELRAMTRKSHKKSRLGCFKCKQKRTKCDEQRPHCQSCVKHDTECNYPASTTLKWVNNPPLRTSARELSQTSPSAYGTTLQDHNVTAANSSLNLENIDLIIKWFTETVHTVVPTSNYVALRTSQTVILAAAMRHPFLLHGLLALSALHIAGTHSDSARYTEKAMVHHAQGLELFHIVLTKINEENYSAAIAFSSLTLFFSFGFSRPRPGKAIGTEIIDNLAQITMLAKGWDEIASVADSLECRAGLPSIKPSLLRTSTFSLDTQLAFYSLDRLIRERNQDVIIYDAVSLLKSVFMTLENGKSDDPHVAVSWIQKIPDGFVRLLKEKENLALVVAGFYCVILNKLPQVWWLSGWSKGLFGAVWGAVDCDCKEVLEWPRQIIEVNSERE